MRDFTTGDKLFGALEKVPEKIDPEIELHLGCAGCETRILEVGEILFHPPRRLREDLEAGAECDGEATLGYLSHPADATSRAKRSVVDTVDPDSILKIGLVVADEEHWPEARLQRHSKIDLRFVTGDYDEQRIEASRKIHGHVVRTPTDDGSESVLLDHGETNRQGPRLARFRFRKSRAFNRFDTCGARLGRRIGPRSRWIGRRIGAGSWGIGAGSWGIGLPGRRRHRRGVGALRLSVSPSRDMVGALGHYRRSDQQARQRARDP